MEHRLYAIIPVAGSGRRMGSDILKQYLQLGDRPVLAHTLSAFERVASIDAVILVIDPQEEHYIKSEIINNFRIEKPIYFLAGGRQRQQSVANALDFIKRGEFVVIHDGVRPLVSHKVIEDTIKTARQYGAAAAGMPVKDTIKKVNKGGYAVSTPDRNTLWQIQTPQAFSLELIKVAHKRAVKDGHIGTDDSSLVERLGHPVKLVEGGYYNIKITTREDIEIAQQLIKTGVYK